MNPGIEDKPDTTQDPFPSEDPLSKCMQTERPCIPGSVCVLSVEGMLVSICDPCCVDYVSYNEDDPRADR